MNPLLRADAIDFSYGERPILRKISFQLSPGEVVALIGPNGSGKSTLIKSLLGHIEPTGRIEWDRRELKHWRRRDLAKLVAYLPQAPFSDPDQRVADVIRMGRAPFWRAFGIESDHDLHVVRDIASLLGITSLLERKMHQLSGGQQQMIFFARCLAQEPQAMLLDEPNTFLDLKHQVELLRLLRKLSREKNLAILLASHDLNLAAAFSDRLILLHNGTIAAHGAPSAVLNEDILSRVYELPIEVRDGRVFPTVNH